MTNAKHIGGLAGPTPIALNALTLANSDVD